MEIKTFYKTLYGMSSNFEKTVSGFLEEDRRFLASTQGANGMEGSIIMENQSMMIKGFSFVTMSLRNGGEIGLYPCEQIFGVARPSREQIQRFLKSALDELNQLAPLVERAHRDFRDLAIEI